ncbi:MAG TPA: nucleoside hydrolase, partial [Thermodesulfobacteriota bacterium]|nr:nucleoside hydrolase [Thermodesulfobacteriota bacterium]
VTLIPLDATRQAGLTSKMMEDIRKCADPFSRFALHATGYDAKIGKFPKGRGAFYLHDPLAVAAAIDATLVRTEKLPLSIDTEGKFYGRVREKPGNPEIAVAFGLDAGRFFELFLSRLKG